MTEQYQRSTVGEVHAREDTTQIELTHSDDAPPYRAARADPTDRSPNALPAMTASWCV